MVFGVRKNKKIKIKDDFNLNWYGHRGLLNRAPENTWLGFQAALRIIKCIDNTFETGLLFEDIRTVGLISFVCPNHIHPRSDIVTGDLIEYAKRYKLGINVWTVNSRVGMKFFIEKKVEGIITDCPEAIPNVI